jgi:hypothetical protein
MLMLAFYVRLGWKWRLFQEVKNHVYTKKFFFYQL